jgi:hypothetical protein
VNTQKLLKIFNKKALEWLSDLKAIDDLLIHRKPTERSWSYSEVYDHAMRVSRSYQIPNLKISVTESAQRRKRKNKYGIAVFNIGIRKNIKMKMEEFPAPLVENFTPVKRSKTELIQDFSAFIQEVNDLEDLLNTSTKDNKQYHPMFGDISTKEWFALIELHMWQHDKQKNKIKKYLEANSSK